MPSNFEALNCCTPTTTSTSKNWFVLDEKICGVCVGKFLSNSPLVANFLTEFATVQLSDFKNGRNFYWRGVHNEVSIASSFGVVSAIVRQKFKAEEIDKYLWLVKESNSLNFKTELNDHEDRAASSNASEELQTVCDAIESVERKICSLKLILSEHQPS